MWLEKRMPENSRRCLNEFASALWTLSVLCLEVFLFVCLPLVLLTDWHIERVKFYVVNGSYFPL